MEVLAIEPRRPSGPRGMPLPAPGLDRLRVATYNVHGWIGADGRADPLRVIRVVRGLRAQAVGLQEVTAELAAPGGLELGALAELTGMRVIAGQTMRRGDADFGNVLLTSLPVAGVRRHDLSVPGREPRGALEVDLDTGAQILRVFVTHLGQRSTERHRQVSLILAAIERGGAGPVVVMGDMNEWRPSHRGLRRLDQRLGRPPLRRSYPARWPVLKLDRIWLRPRTGLADVRAVRSGQARLASDHLPVIADLALPRPPTGLEVP